MSSTQATRWKALLGREFAAVDGHTLGIFRIAWGIILLLEGLWLLNETQGVHHPEHIHFYFQGFSWIQHFPEGWMTELEVAAMLIAAVLITLGVGYRFAAAIYFLGYTHLFFAEAAAYNNHFYLTSLLCGLLILTRADASLSLRQWFRSKRNLPERSVPQWNYDLPRFQVVVVYVYGAIAKLNHDWFIELEPIRFWMSLEKDTFAWLNALAGISFFAYVAAYGGFLIDLICPFLLLFRRTRLVALIVLFLFHALNSQLFQIGYFPLIGIVLLVIFFEPNRFRRREASLESEPFSRSPILIAAASAFIAFQLLFPLRWHLIPNNNPSWTEVGHRFAWRMMLRERLSSFQVYVDNPDAQDWLKKNPHRQLRMSPMTSVRATESPEFMRQYAVQLRHLLEENGFEDFAIYVHATCSLNGRPFQPYVNPNIDLSLAKPSLFRIPEWVLPAPDDLPIDFAKLSPVEHHPRLAYESMKAYFENNPGPGAAFLTEPTP